MRHRTIKGLGLLGLGILLNGCEGGVAVNYYDDDRPTRVVHVDHGHVCGPGCDHFYDGARYVLIRGHRHGPGCGHFLEGSRWIVVARTPSHVHVDHVCGPSCHDHYWDGGKIVVIRGRHRHGPGCGHILEGGHWMIGVARGPNHVAVEVGKGPATRVHIGADRVLRIPPPPGPIDVYVFNRSGSKWLRIAKGHKHGPGCGHVHVEGHWCLP